MGLLCVREEQEQEQEQEEEQQNMFSREDEQPNAWPCHLLGQSPNEPWKEAGNAKGGDPGHPFFQLRSFRSRAEEPTLPFPEHLWITDNSYRPLRPSIGDRKLCSAFVLVEWQPEFSKERYQAAIKKLVHNLHQKYIAENPEGNANTLVLTAINDAMLSL